jgi:hypothetical protein
LIAMEGISRLALMDAWQRSRRRRENTLEFQSQSNQKPSP